MNLHLSRRKFLITSAAAGSALVLGVTWQQFYGLGRRAQRDSQLSAWIEIHPDNQVILTLAKSEMGQGVSTALPMLLAEELEVDWNTIQVKQANEPLNVTLGRQNTGGSSSIHDSWKMLRQAGAIARELLISAAALKLQAKRNTLFVKDGIVYERGTQRQLPYGDLVAMAKNLPLPQTVSLKEKRDYQLIGKNIARLDLSERLNGKARYGADIKFKDSVVAVIKQCPQFGGTSPHIVNREEVLKHYLGANLVESVIVEHDFVSVVAKDFWVANKVLNEFHIEWQIPQNPYNDSEKIYQFFAEALSKTGVVVKQQGAIESDSQGDIHEAVYVVPFQAHATMEPMNCSAHFHDGIVEVWAPTQDPAAAYSEVLHYGFSRAEKWLKKLSSRITNSASQDIKLHTTYLGCGLGRRLQQDYVVQAVLIAKRLTKPVNLIWSREEDMQHDYYRPGNISRLRATLDANGYPQMWDHKIVGPSISMSLWPGSVKNGRDHLAFEPANRIPYSIPIQRVEYVAANTRVPVGMWRSVGLSQNTFAIETFIDELAHLAKRDPAEYRHTLLSQDQRYQRILNVAIKLSGWNTKDSKYGYGIALERSYGSYIVTIVKVARAESGIKIDEVISAVDCGQVIHPDIVKSQIEGANIFALTAATYGETTFKNGAVVQSNFHNYPIMTMTDAPKITVEVMDSNEEPGGVGELGVPPVAPALVNAIFNLTEKRIRKLPVALNNI